MNKLGQLKTSVAVKITQWSKEETPSYLEKRNCSAFLQTYFNHFQVSFTGNVPSQKIPGSSYEIRIQSSPYSHVGILAVDQSVYLLRNDKHLTHDEVRRYCLNVISLE